MSNASPPPIEGPDRLEIRRALLSVSDKSGIVELARSLVAEGVEVVSTGGTARVIAEAGLPVAEVSALTGMPELMDGRLKTLHPRIHGGLLALRDDPAHLAAMTDFGIRGIDCLVVNLYPFEAMAERGGAPGDIIESIDVGGPAMIRAAAKNSAWVSVLTDPADYARFLAALRAGGVPRMLRYELAGKAFRRLAAYDAAIARWMGSGADAPESGTPEHFLLTGTLSQRLRYGENPHQQAVLYAAAARGPGIATARQLQGKPLSYNNVADAAAALDLVSDLPADRPSVVIVKHANPCGAAVGANLQDAYRRALACDPHSAYGGIVATNRRLDTDAAAAITELFTEVVVAPDADEAAIAAFASKPNLRLLLTGGLVDPTAPRSEMRTIAGGGILVQEADRSQIGSADCRVVTKRAPTAEEMADLLFAAVVAKHVKSNAIVYARDGATVGIGAGQMSRVDAARIAAVKAAAAASALGLSEPLTRGSVVASDAFFPFADGLLAAAEAGATAVIQPGGSLRDDEVIAAADEAGVAMVFTGIRNFRH
jgi:phosphoribosylaminoimidazolecarboxamide formyltransferase/IMP cyclohydrolase